MDPEDNGFVDFDDFDEPKPKQEQYPDSDLSFLTNTLYKKDTKPVFFDQKTMLYYIAMRTRKMCPISFKEMDDESNAFTFHNQWNPLTGERSNDRDPYGPLYFDPNDLVKYFYENRLNGLWVPESHTDGEYYEGYYDCYIGSGEDMYVQSRGYNPDKYLFRLPIIDCYWLYDNANNNIITFGPKLTDSEIKLIDSLAARSPYVYNSSHRPSLVQMKNYYDTALSKTPTIPETENMTQEERVVAYNAANRRAVDMLRKIKG
ncbi:MAG: hypothetical protein Terrestrivirus4_207 [Terrestrivirus sp.]|uniref:Uncharacterized protein n=1 Tax=Terrestrivirus sp. TaxID=2487775 RepID=A0A3G4ZRW3_9VIRU|nr:MAG: hypothetical protein Terrestrivirus4_207 [Terrestrivirus sp.]